MNESEALAAFLALSQEPRLRIVRLLIEAGPDGLPAGRISGALGGARSNASFHLAHLEKAGLVNARRDGRSIVYSVAFEAIGGLVDYLMKDCCGGRPELCEPVSAAAFSCRKPALDLAEG